MASNLENCGGCLILPPWHNAPKRWRVYMVARWGRFLAVVAYKRRQIKHGSILRYLSSGYRTYDIRYYDMSDLELFIFQMDNNIIL